MQLDDYHIRILDILREKKRGSVHAHFSGLRNKTGFPAKTLTKKLHHLREWNLIVYPKPEKGKKGTIRITQKGIKELIKRDIRISYGLVGLEWAEEAWKKGYRVRFLSDFTQIEAHERLLIAWHPRKGDVKLAEIFGVKEFRDVPGGPSYVGQYVDRKISPNGPIRANTLQSYITKNVDQLDNDEEIGEAAKKFFEEHNSFIAVLLPKENLAFGFPEIHKKRWRSIQEIGRFGALMLVGFIGKGDIPFIPRMTLMTGGFNLSENLGLELNYDVSLDDLYSFAWLTVRQQISPSSVDPQQYDEWRKKTWVGSFKPQIRIACRNSDGGEYCRKLKKRCMALVDHEHAHEGKYSLDFKKCQIIVEEARKVRIKE